MTFYPKFIFISLLKNAPNLFFTPRYDLAPGAHAARSLIAAILVVQFYEQAKEKFLSLCITSTFILYLSLMYEKNQIHF